MVRVNLQKAILLYLSWLAVISGALILSLSDILPFKLSFVRPDNLFVCLTECQVFFVLLVWPLFIPSITREEPDPDPQAGAVHLLLMQICVLIVFALPLALICSNVANVSALTFLRGQALVAALAAFVSVLYAVTIDRKWRVGPWYFLGMFLVSAGLPFLSFLAGDFGGKDLSSFSLVSPFWGAAHVDGKVSLIQAGIYAGLTVALLMAGSFRRATVDAPPAAG